ncbi:hypothetical protein FZEAL_79 [Fusarium zealandicum]|uniref:PPM-type phosphatase domain-containing protein n=1 Tax=Fusarium zealandicum TaxID=1053134 RepID=A0A8H4UVU8_9HYPO|nr:hypothetical protein FZEAL_79 [Fusarium zealandicum]
MFSTRVIKRSCVDPRALVITQSIYLQHIQPISVTSYIPQPHPFRCSYSGRRLRLDDLFELLQLLSLRTKAPRAVRPTVNLTVPSCGARLTDTFRFNVITTLAMFRVSTRALRPSSAPTSRVSTHFTRARFSSTITSQTASSARSAWSVAALVGIGGSGIYLLGGKDSKTSSVAETQHVPTLKGPASEDQIPVHSPVWSLTLEAANAKLREDAHSFVFEGNGGVKGRVDVARVSSNNPVEDEWDLKVAKGVDGVGHLYSGVYDGHAGWATSRVLREALIPSVSGVLSTVEATSSDELVDEAIKRAFVRLDDRIFNKAAQAVKAGHEPGSAEVISAIAPAIAGSCALLSIYNPRSSTLRTAVTGDSRAVRGAWSSEAQKYEADVLSKDQTGFNQDEVDRLDREHPGEKKDILSPDSGRLLGMMVTRAFGDHRWKWPEELICSARDNFYGTSPRPKFKTPPYMTARPEITKRTVQTEDFVILASDGLWDMISNDHAVACVSRWLAAKKTGQPEPFKEKKFELEGKLDDGWQATPEHFAIEDLDSAAVCLVKNALGGSRRGLFLGALTTYAPMSRNVRDDMTVQVIFFKDPYERK